MEKKHKTPKAMLEGVKRYNASPKGLETRKRYLEKHREELLKYSKEYSARRRKALTEKSLCWNCKEPTKTTKRKCADCLRITREKTTMIVNDKKEE